MSPAPALPIDETAFQLSLLEATLNASLDGILVVDHTTSKVRQVNRRFIDLWRIPKDLAKSRDDNALIGYVLSMLKNPDEFLALVRELYANPERTSFDILNFLDGRIVERHSEPLLMEGKVLGRVWYFRDVTERVNTQSQLVHASRLASLGEMAGGIAHEINNPLTVIRGRCAYLLAMMDKGNTPSEELLRRDIQAVIGQAVRIDKIVKGLRNYARENSSDPFVTVTLKEIMDDTLAICSERFLAEGVRLVTPELENNFSFACRPTQIVQVLVNLLNNAHDAVINLSDRSVEVVARQNGKHVSILVSDSGPGIPDSIREKVMQPFFTTKSVGKGTGLGLSISLGIMQQHGGTLRLRPDISSSCIELFFPSQQANFAPMEAI